MATGGGGFKRSWSRVDRIQPTWRRAQQSGSARPKMGEECIRHEPCSWNSPCRHPRKPESSNYALCGTFPAWAREDRNSQETCDRARARQAPTVPESLVGYSRLPGSPLAQVKDLSRIQIPQERLDNLSALQGQSRDNEEGMRRQVSGARRGDRVVGTSYNKW